MNVYIIPAWYPQEQNKPQTSSERLAGLLEFEGDHKGQLRFPEGGAYNAFGNNDQSVL